MYDDSLVLCLKISQSKWIELLKNGSAWFGKIDGYIKKAIESNNDDQGDRYEGIFAHVRKDAIEVDKYRAALGDDLEIVDDGDFYFLRRKSSRMQKAFCLYGIKKSELTVIEVYNPEAESPVGKFRYNISPRMYNGFLQDGGTAADVAGYYCSAGHINCALEEALRLKGHRWKRAMIQYDIDLNSEFIIEPTDGYPELWHKRKELSYQHESRIIIYDDADIDGIALPYTPLKENSGNWAMGELYIKGTATLFRK